MAQKKKKSAKFNPHLGKNAHLVNVMAALCGRCALHVVNVMQSE